LEHGLPDEKLERMYKKVDWEEFKGNDPEFISVKGHKIPYVVFNNMPEVTNDFSKLSPVMDDCFNKLWKLKIKDNYNGKSKIRQYEKIR